MNGITRITGREYNSTKANKIRELAGTVTRTEKT